MRWAPDPAPTDLPSVGKGKWALGKLEGQPMPRSSATARPTTCTHGRAGGAGTK